MTDKNQSTTMRGQFRYIILREGYRGLYRGFLPNALKVMPAVSISYVTYEYCRRKMGAKMS
jgi:solute carrier family 25 phosphate transporter 23/24/25/41